MSMSSRGKEDYIAHDANGPVNPRISNPLLRDALNQPFSIMSQAFQWRLNAIYFALPLLILSSLILTIGLTCAPCYSSLCVEEYFSRQTRGHIGLFYGLLVGVGLALWARVRFTGVRDFCEWQPAAFDRAMLITRKRFSVGALLLAIWIAGLTFGGVAYWYPAQHQYWLSRGETVDWTHYIFRIVWTGITGHWVDLWIGLVIIPVGRNSILSRVFQLHLPTLLFAHKLLAYSLLAGSLVHGLIYYSFLAAYADAAVDPSIEHEFTPDNPALTIAQASARGVYSYFVLVTGAAAGLVLIPVIAITSLPILRRSSYNVFYYVHVIFAAAVMVLVSLHASTNFYFLLPGLLLWISDWVWRLRNALGTTTTIQIEDAENGWYRSRLPPQDSSHRWDDEKCSGAPLTHQALATYYLNAPEISRTQLHAFSIATYSQTGPLILFRRGPERKKAKQRDGEWTWKLAAMVDNLAVDKTLTLNARIEGPYLEHTTHFYSSDHVLLIAGGTGITGAICIANMWLAHQASKPGKSLRLVWTVRDEAVGQVQEVQQLRVAMDRLPNADITVHVSSQAGRIDLSATLDEFLFSQGERSGRIWLYASGPEGLLIDAEAAYTKQRRLVQACGLGGTISALNCLIASFEG